MKNSILQFLFIFLSTIFSIVIPLHAQLIIAKDYNACLYGMKDQSGKWIVKPEYTHIEPFDENGCAITTKDEKSGVIDNTGKILIPCIYSSIEFPYQTQWTYYSYYKKMIKRFFIARDTLSGDVGVVDSTGKVIVPFEYYEIAPFGDSTIFAKNPSGEWLIYGFHGKQCGKVPETSDKPIHIMPNTNLITTGYMYGGPYGACDDHGKMIIPMKYDSIIVRSNIFFVAEAWNNGKVTYYNTNGKYFVGENLEASKTYFVHLSFMHEYGIEPVKFSGKWGILNYKGETIVPFIYDTINSIYFTNWQNPDSEKVFFLIKQNDKCGIVSSTGRIILPCEFENIQWGMEDAYLGDGKFDTGARFLLVKKNNKWGAIKTNGELVMSCDYDTIFKIDNNNFLFWKNDESLLFKINNSCPKVACYTPWAEIKNWAKEYRSYDFNSLCEYDIPAKYNNKGFNLSCITETYDPGQSESTWNPYSYGVVLDCKQVFQSEKVDFTSSAKNFFLLKDSFNLSKWYNNTDWRHFGVWEDDKKTFHLVDKFISDSVTGIWYTSIDKPYCLISENGKAIMPAVLSEKPEIFSSSPLFFEVRGRKEGLCDENGKLIIDTSYFEIRKGPHGFAWVNTSICLKNEDSYCYACWNLYDLKIQKNIFDTLHLVRECYYNGDHTFPISSIHGAGLYNAGKNKMMLEPTFKAVNPLNYPVNNFFVMDCNNKIGVVDSNGKFIVSMIYDRIVIAEKPFYDPDHYRKRRASFVLSNDSTAIFIDTNETIKPFDDQAKIYLYDDGVQRGILPRKWQTSNDDANYVPAVYAYNYHLNSSQKIIIADSLFTGEFSPGYTQTKNFPIASCSCIVPVHYYEGGGTVIEPYSEPINDGFEVSGLTILFCNDSIISAGQENFFGNSLYSKKERPYWTLIWYSTGPRAASLDSLFTGTHWKITISNYVMNYLSAHSEISSDCANPSKWPEILENRFAVEKDGLHLFPEWKYDLQGNYLKFIPEIIIPWNELLPDLRPGMQAKIEMPE